MKTPLGKDRLALASRLKQARDMAGLSQGQVAKLLDMHRPSVTEIESGNRKVSADELAAFAATYDVSPTWLLGLTPDKLEIDDPQLALAAREMSKLKKEDLEQLLSILATMRETK
jgi:transcriptional regulator with XRE-family HTH domain